ncbi:hypothetical protein U0070_020493, partial [Myodes glareolus]
MMSFILFLDRIFLPTPSLVSSAQFAGLLCEEEGNGADNVQYCGYCKYHFSKLDKHHEKEKK